MKNKIAVVTGANRGLGYATSEQLAQQGFTVYMTGRDQTKIEKAVDTLKSKDLDVVVSVLDVTSAEQIEAFVKKISEKHDRLDVLINNAGIFLEAPEPKLMEQASVFSVPEETIIKTIDINTLGPLRMIRSLMPYLRKSTSGRIVNVSSGMGQLSEMNGFCPGYRISKTALNTVTAVVAAELGESSIKINSVCPGWVRTDMGGDTANLSVEQGIAGIIWAATLPEDGPTGGFFRDGQSIDW